jgi:hypothetical protein
MTDLFGRHDAEKYDENNQPLPQNSANRYGQAGELLVLADLKIRGYEAALVDGLHTDVVANINGLWRLFQVKSKLGMDTCFRAGGGDGRNGRSGRRPVEYKDKIDAFALVKLSMKLIYYISIDAVAYEDQTILINNFSRQTCDLSFNELLRRWGCTASEAAE